MPTENYDRLLANKQDTQVNIKSYLESQQEVDHDQRKQELQSDLNDAQFGPKADGSYDLIRDCINQETTPTNPEKAEQISYIIQSTNLLLGCSYRLI